MATISSNSIVLIVVVGVFIIVDIIISVFIIIESGKYNSCLKNESPYCLSFSCPYTFGSGYKPFTSDQYSIENVNFDNKQTQTTPDPSIASTKCLGFPYRLIDKTKGYEDSNIECRFTQTGGIDTQTPTTPK